MQRLKTSESSLNYLSLEQIRKLVSSVSDTRDNLIIRVLYETGCSLNELTAIKVNHLLGSRIRIKNTETKEIRHSTISAKLAKDLRLFIKGNRLDDRSCLFSTRQSDSISEKRIRQIIQKYTKDEFSEKINPQSFRYYHIAHAYSNGMMLETIARQIGITTARIFKILSEMKISPKQNYNKFLRKV